MRTCRLSFELSAAWLSLPMSSHVSTCLKSSMGCNLEAIEVDTSSQSSRRGSFARTRSQAFATLRSRDADTLPQSQQGDHQWIVPCTRLTGSHAKPSACTSGGQSWPLSWHMPHAVRLHTKRPPSRNQLVERQLCHGLHCGNASPNH